MKKRLAKKVISQYLRCERPFTKTVRSALDQLNAEALTIDIGDGRPVERFARKKNSKSLILRDDRITKIYYFKI